MKHLLITVIFSATFITLFAQFPHRPKPKSESSQQQQDTPKPVQKNDSEPAKKDTPKPIQKDASKKIVENTTKPAIVEKKFRRLDLVGLHLERAVSHKNTIVVSPALDFLYLYDDGDELPRIGIGLLPKIEFSYRHYYNLENRKILNKHYINNSGSYVSGKIELQIFIASGYGDNIVTFAFGPLWGVQNNKGPVTINFEIGPGLVIVFPENLLGITNIGKLKIGFLLDR